MGVQFTFVKHMQEFLLNSCGCFGNSHVHVNIVPFVTAAPTNAGLTLLTTFRDISKSQTNFLYAPVILAIWSVVVIKLYPSFSLSSIFVLALRSNQTLSQVFGLAFTKKSSLSSLR